jgi:endonuclease/exonuclease/phosphatase family metal-dependent hydrolase
MNTRITFVLGISLLLTLNTRAVTFRVATYNVANYLDQTTETRKEVKSPEARAKIRESIRAMNPDVIALEEMGTTNALLELRDSLKAEGFDFPYWNHVEGFDTNIHVAVLSKLPIIASRPHTNDSFLLSGRRYRVGRGFAEVTLRAATNFDFTLIAGHLKSRRPSPEADEAELRLQEAKILRNIVDERFKADPSAKIVVLGDFNDVKSSPSTKELIGKGKFKLVDTRPAERNGDNARPDKPWFDPATITWTHFYGKEDSYSRIDYILLSPALAQSWVKSGTFIPTLPNWGVGSDHRPIVAAFDTDKQ